MVNMIHIKPSVQQESIRLQINSSDHCDINKFLRTKNNNDLIKILYIALASQENL